MNGKKIERRMKVLKKAIIIASYGTTKAKAREKSIEPFYQLFREVYDSTNVIQAYTSRYVREKMKEENKCILSPMEAIQAMIEEGCDSIYIQPTHILPGHEYHRILEAIEEVGKQNKKLSIYLGNPLLSDENDMKDILYILKKQYTFEQKNTTYILLGHGTDHDAHDQYAKMEEIAMNLGYPLIMGTIEDGVEEVIKKLGGLQVDKVELIPFLFVAGDHVINDMMGHGQSWKNALEAAKYSVTCHPIGLGELEEIRHYYLEQFKSKFSNM
jgi:sirohydrochlorin cobaltochelatase